VRITFDPAKRAKTLKERGLDFATSAEVFAGTTYSAEDIRFAYPERRILTIGFLAGRMVAIIWTPIPKGRHIISMRKCNAREQAKYAPRFSQG
jgi:uncharacterized protein